MENQWIHLDQDNSVLIRIPFNAETDCNQITIPKKFKTHTLYRLKFNNDIVAFVAGTDDFIINICISIIRCNAWINIKYKDKYYKNIPMSESKCYTILSNIVKYNEKSYDIKLICGLYNAILETDSYWCIQRWEAITKLLNQSLYAPPIVSLFIEEIRETIYCWPDFFGFKDFLILDKNQKTIKQSQITQIKDEDYLWMIMQTFLQNTKLCNRDVYIAKLYDFLDKTDPTIKSISNENMLLLLDTHNAVSKLYIYIKIRDTWCALWPSYQKLYNETEPQVEQLIKTAMTTAELMNNHQLAEWWSIAFYKSYEYKKLRIQK